MMSDARSLSCNREDAMVRNPRSLGETAGDDDGCGSRTAWDASRCPTSQHQRWFVQRQLGIRDIDVLNRIVACDKKRMTSTSKLTRGSVDSAR